MKIHRTENGIHISVDIREPGARRELLGLRFMLNAYGPFAGHVAKFDQLTKEFTNEVSGVSESKD